MINEIEISVQVLSFGGGLALGGAYYLGLWWTVTRGIVTQRSALWFAGSLLLRMSFALAGFYLIGGGRWERLVACLLGFLLVQVLATRFAPSAAALSGPGRSTCHAS